MKSCNLCDETATSEVVRKLTGGWITEGKEYCQLHAEQVLALHLTGVPVKLPGSYVG